MDLSAADAVLTIVVIIATLVGLTGVATFVRGGYVKARLEDAETRIDGLVGEVSDYKRRWQQSEEDRANDRVGWNKDREVMDAKINDLRNTNHALERVKFGQDILLQIVEAQKEMVRALGTNTEATLTAIAEHHTEAMEKWGLTSTALENIVAALQHETGADK